MFFDINIPGNLVLLWVKKLEQELIYNHDEELDFIIQLAKENGRSFILISQ